MTSNANCLTTPTANSNQVVMNITTQPASVSITSTSTSICAGGSITFTANPTNGGLTPAYQWFINGTAVPGATGATFTTATLTSNDAVTVQLTSSDACSSPATATSNAIDITTSTVTPTVAIAADQNPVCTGTAVTFTTTATDGGAAPTYQWFINGNAVAGATNSTFTSSTLANNDVVTVVMTSNSNCLTTPTANSNQVVMNITTQPASVSITSTSTSICTGGSITFTAAPTNGGLTPAYQWF